MQSLPPDLFWECSTQLQGNVSEDGAPGGICNQREPESTTRRESCSVLGPHDIRNR